MVYLSRWISVIGYTGIICDYGIVYTALISHSYVHIIYFIFLVPVRSVLTFFTSFCSYVALGTSTCGYKQFFLYIRFLRWSVSQLHVSWMFDLVSSSIRCMFFSWLHYIIYMLCIVRPTSVAVIKYLLHLQEGHLYYTNRRWWITRV